MDGVVLVGAHTHPRVYRAAAHDALRELGVDDVTPDHAVTLQGGSYDPAMADACDALGIDHDAWWAARERHACRRANARLRAGARRTFPDTDALYELASGRQLGLVSNNRNGTAAFVADYCFPDVFEVALGRQPTLDDYGRRKPEPDFIDRALDRLDATDGIYVGDRETDVVAARRAGLDAVLLDRDGRHGDPDVDPDHTVASLSELPGLLEEG